MPRKSGDERALGEVGPVDVAVGEPDARDADLARSPRRERHVLLRIEDHDRIGRQRDTDRYRPVRGSSLQVAVTVASVGP